VILKMLIPKTEKYPTFWNNNLNVTTVI
jgi:hypothetical protein